MKTVILSLAALVAVSACADLRSKIGLGPPSDAMASQGAESAQAAPQAVVQPSALPIPNSSARTAEQFDTTTTAQRAAAAAPKPSASKTLGTTVVSLGSPTEPGFWLKTPLVNAQTQGQVTNPANGKSAAVTLIPIDGPATAGSRMSLPALRLIGADLTALTKVEVSTGG